MADAVVGHVDADVGVERYCIDAVVSDGDFSRRLTVATLDRVAAVPPAALAASVVDPPSFHVESSEVCFSPPHRIVGFARTIAPSKRGTSAPRGAGSCPGFHHYT